MKRMNRLFPKAIGLLLALLLLASLAACGEKKPPVSPTDTTPSTEAGTGPVDPDAAFYEKTDLTKTDWTEQGESEFVIRYAAGTTFVPTPVDIDADEAYTSIVSSAGYARDGRFAELTGLNIEYVRADTNPNSLKGGSDDETAALRALVSGNMIKDFDMIMTGSRAAGVMVAELFYTDLSQYDQYINPTAEYYPADMNELLRIGSRQFLATGYHTTYNLSAASVMVVNKSILAASEDVHGYTMEDLYAYTMDNEWTMSLMMQIGNTYASVNEGGDPANNRYAAVFGANPALSAFYALGGNTISRDIDGNPQVALTQNDTELIGWFRTNVTENPNVFIAPNDGEQAAFAQNNAMFGMQILAALPSLKNMDMDVAYLPMPVYESGDDYRSPIEAWCFNVAGIPAGVENPDFAAYCYEVFMALSHEYVYTAFYEQVTGLQWVQEAAEAKVHAIVTNSLYVDVASAYQWHSGGSDTNLKSLLNNSSAADVGSTVTGVRSALQASIKDFMEKYQ